MTATGPFIVVHTPILFQKWHFMFYAESCEKIPRIFKNPVISINSTLEKMFKNAVFFSWRPVYLNQSYVYQKFHIRKSRSAPHGDESLR